MDLRRLDAFARALARTLSRRHALIAGLGGFPIVLSSMQEAAGKRKHDRNNRKQDRNDRKRRRRRKRKGQGGAPGGVPASSPCAVSWLPQSTFGNPGSGASQFRDPQGVAVAADGKTAWVADTRNNRIAVWVKPGDVWQLQTTFGGIGAGPNQLLGPMGVAATADGQTVWVADTNNDRIAVWTRSGNSWTPQAAFGSGGRGGDEFDHPRGVAVAADGQTVWVADRDNNRIAVWVKTGDTWQPRTTFGSRGTGPDQFREPGGVAVAADGLTAWVADTANDRIAIWTRSGESWSPQGAIGGAGEGAEQFRDPAGVAVAANGQTLWVADAGNKRIAVWAKAGNSWSLQSTVVSNGPGAGELNFPQSVAVSADGQTVWVADSLNGRIAVWTASGGSWQPQSTFGSPGSGPGQFNLPYGLAMSGNGLTAWVAERGNDRISIWTRSDGVYQYQGSLGQGTAPQYSVKSPEGVAASADGQWVWVVDRGNSQIAVWTIVATAWRWYNDFGVAWGTTFQAPAGVAVSPDGQTVWIADSRNSRIVVAVRKPDADGYLRWEYQTEFGRRNVPEKLYIPVGVAVSADGQTAWVVDYGTGKVSVWTNVDNRWTRQAIFGSYGNRKDQHSSPSGIAVAADGQTVWVADRDNHRISVWAKEGGRWTWRANFGSNGSGPDQFTNPNGVVVSADGRNVLVADAGNDRVAVWTLACPGS